MEFESNMVELHFRLRGDKLASDHAYSLYSALSSLIPETHGANWLGIHTIKGRKTSNGIIQLGQSAFLRLRLPAEKVPIVCKLAGAILDIGEYSIRCGVPEIHLLRPARKLRSRFVMIKVKGSEGKSAEVTSFLSSLEKQIAALNVAADVMLEKSILSAPDDDFVCRRVLRVKSATLTGYGVILDNLSERDSLLVQEVGLGGKRRMGCGLFDPLGRGGE